MGLEPQDSAHAPWGGQATAPPTTWTVWPQQRPPLCPSSSTLTHGSVTGAGEAGPCCCHQLQSLRPLPGLTQQPRLTPGPSGPTHSHCPASGRMHPGAGRGIPSAHPDTDVRPQPRRPGQVRQAAGPTGTMQGQSQSRGGQHRREARGPRLGGPQCGSGEVQSAEAEVG